MYDRWATCRLYDAEQLLSAFKHILKSTALAQTTETPTRDRLAVWVVVGKPGRGPAGHCDNGEPSTRRWGLRVRRNAVPAALR